MATCPICDAPVTPKVAGARFPFCSQRCKLVDLDNWLGGRYVVAQALPFSEEELEALALDADGEH
jgi:endogenous inhibitor of DNA gyrase (YacG/DUF329 family)